MVVLFLILLGIISLGGYVGDLVTEWFFNRDV